MATSPTSDQGHIRPAETLRGVFWTLALAVIVIYAFFGILGAFWLGDAVPLTILVAAFALLWVAHAIAEHRRHDETERDPRLRAARSRRGF